MRQKRFKSMKRVLKMSAAILGILTFISFVLPRTVAAASAKVIYLDTAGSGTWTVPSDWYSAQNTIEAIGGGAGGGTLAATSSARGGGGGGAYSANTNMTLTPGATVYYTVGSGGGSLTAGGDTWFNTTANSAPTSSAYGILAKGGAISTSASSGGAGGASGSGIGVTRNSGGAGGKAQTSCTTNGCSGGGGGGAGGPNGAGKAGGGGPSSSSVRGGGGGGAAENGVAGSSSSSATGGAGGNSNAGSGGGSGGTSGVNGGTGATGGGGGGGYGSAASPTSGGAGSTDPNELASRNSDAAHGPGSGGGGGGGYASGSTNANGGNGGQYGGGGGSAGSPYSGTSFSANGSGGQGLIVIGYIPAPVVTSYTNNTEPALSYSPGCTNCGARIGPGSAFRQSITITGSGFGADPGVGNRATAANHVGVGNMWIADANVISWSDTSITFYTDTTVTGNADSDWGAEYGGVQRFGVESNGSISNAMDFYMIPQILSITQAAGLPADSAREYNFADSDGVITLNGTRFGTDNVNQHGFVRILGCDASTCSSPSGSATVVSWGNSSVTVQVPTVIANNAYTGSIVLQQGQNTSTNYPQATYANTFRILPRITGISPSSVGIGSSITFNGDHLCENAGSCPTGFDANDQITFYSAIAATTFTGWTNTTAATVIPTGVQSGGVILTSNGYASNAFSITIQSPAPNDPTKLDQYRNSGLTKEIAVGSTSSSTPIYITMTMDPGISSGTLYPEVEMEPIGTPFACTAASPCASAQEGAGVTSGSLVDCTNTSNGCAIAVSPADNVYHWQARVRKNISGVDYYSNWVSYPVGSGSRTDITNGLVGEWNVNECSGTTVADSSGLGNNATLVNNAGFDTTVPSWATGCSIGLSGATSPYADVPYNANMNPGGNTMITVSTWFQMTPPEDENFVWKWGGSNAWALGFSASWGNQIVFNPAQCTYPGIAANVDISSGTWHFAAGTYDGSTVKVYYDGNLAGSAPCTGTIPDDLADVGIGGYGYGSVGTGWFKATHLYNRALSAAEIAQLYEGEVAAQSSYAPKRIYLTTTGAGTWTVPADWNSASNTIEVVGGGAGGGHAWGGGGGAYAAISNLVLLPGSSVSYSVGAGAAGIYASNTGDNGADTWFDGSTVSLAQVAAKGGIGGNGSGTNGSNLAGTIGTTVYSGGAGGSDGGSAAGSGGGGAAGPMGAGGAGGQMGNSTSINGGGGGGANGGSAGSTGDAGGAGGVPGGGAGGIVGHEPGYDATSTAVWDSSHGIGGGGGGAFQDTSISGGAGGLYGGGGGGGATVGTGTGGNGAQGIIVITYTPVASGNTESDTDIKIDTTPPAITNVSAGTPATNSATITWSTLTEAGTSQVQYNTTGTFTSNCSTYNDCTTLDSTYVTSHSVALANLSSGTTYYYRVRSMDAVGNLASSTVGSFMTQSVTKPAKTTRFKISGLRGQIAGGSSTSTSITAVMPEGGKEVRSAFIAIRGEYTTTGTAPNGIQVQVGSEASRTYAVPTGSADTGYFSIFHPVASLPVSPATTTLTISPQSGTSFYILSSDLYVTYDYTP